MGIKTILIDANVLLALIDRKDKCYSRASALAMGLRKSNCQVVYLDCVLKS